MNNLDITTHYKRIMVIDDCDVDLYIAEQRLKKHGFANEVVLVNSTRKALDYLKASENNLEMLPQIIFLDIKMPDIDGFGFLQEYEKLSDIIKMNCSIIMLSSSLESSDHERTKNNKYVNGFINKPLNQEKLDNCRIFF